MTTLSGGGLAVRPLEQIRDAILWLSDHADEGTGVEGRPDRGIEALAHVYVAWPSRVWGTGVWLREYANGVTDETVAARFGPLWPEVVDLVVRLGDTPAYALRAVSGTPPRALAEGGVRLRATLELDRRLQASACGAAALRATAHVNGESGPIWAGYAAWAYCLRDLVEPSSFSEMTRPLAVL